jgi:hypothetical protein
MDGVNKFMNECLTTLSNFKKVVNSDKFQKCVSNSRLEPSLKRAMPQSFTQNQKDIDLAFESKR